MHRNGVPQTEETHSTIPGGTEQYISSCAQKTGQPEGYHSSARV